MIMIIKLMILWPAAESDSESPVTPVLQCQGVRRVRSIELGIIDHHSLDLNHDIDYELELGSEPDPGPRALACAC